MAERNVLKVSVRFIPFAEYLRCSGKRPSDILVNQHCAYQDSCSQLPARQEEDDSQAAPAHWDC